MARTGRPPIEPKHRKGDIFNFRVSEDERKMIERAATMAGAKNASAWAREIVLAEATKNA